jgi:hypothetical protein
MHGQEEMSLGGGRASGLALTRHVAIRRTHPQRVVRVGEETGVLATRKVATRRVCRVVAWMDATLDRSSLSSSYSASFTRRVAAASNFFFVVVVQGVQGCKKAPRNAADAGQVPGVLGFPF